MVTCAVVSCKNSSGKITKDKDGITFHRFPRDDTRRRQWELAIDREQEWTSSDSSVVCSDHFGTKDFYLTESGLRRLSLDAVPSINISPCEEPEPTITEQVSLDIDPTDTEEMIELKQKIRRLEALSEDRRKRLLTTWRAKRKLRSKLLKMKEFILHLLKTRKEMRENGDGDREPEV